MIHEETEVQRLFSNARMEIQSHQKLLEESTYGFSAEWFPEKLETEIDTTGEIDLHAVQTLFEARSLFPGSREAIVKFCLPILAAAKCEIAIGESFDSIVDTPHLARDFSRYLSAFVKDDERLVRQVSSALFSEDLLYDSQRMWLMACLLQTPLHVTKTVDESLKLLRKTQFSSPVRALAALYVGAHGTAAQRRMLKQFYNDQDSPYVRAAILYASKYFPKNERETCINSWGNHSTLNSLVAKTVKKSVL